MSEVSFTEIEGLRRASAHEIQVYFWTTASVNCFTHAGNITHSNIGFSLNAARLSLLYKVYLAQTPFGIKLSVKFFIFLACENY